MKDAYQVLRSKEIEMARLRQEIESLKAVIPLLMDSPELDASERGESHDSVPEPQETGTDGPVASGDNSGSRFWSFGRRSEH
jgi:hypothetical protein